MRGYPSAAFYAAKLSPVPQHFASRQAPPLPRRLRAEPKINGQLSDARLDKPRFALKAQVFADSFASATTLACASLLAKPSFPVTLAGAVLRERNAPTVATSARAYGTTRTSLCSLSLSSALTLAGAVPRVRNAPTAASSARANDTTTCSVVQTAHRNGECHFRSLGSSAQQFATSRSHDSSAPVSRCRLRPGTPQAMVQDIITDHFL